MNTDFTQLADFQLPSPLVLLDDPRLDAAGIQVWVKRDDLLHVEVSGNKWRKLKYNLLQARQLGKSGILTFGGTFSNHIYAAAAVGKWFKLPTIGIIRGDRIDPLNTTLTFAESCGMQLHFVSRTRYRNKQDLTRELASEYPNHYLLPEGGTNAYALPGCAELAAEVNDQLPKQGADYWCLSCGTGGTMAGLLTGLKGQSQVLGFSALKGDFHQKEIKTLLETNEYPIYNNWQINTAYHFGGYARYQPALLNFIHDFSSRHSIPLEPIYTGKLFYGIFDLVAKQYFPRGSTIVALHTGGLQGIAGFVQRHGIDWPRVTA